VPSKVSESVRITGTGAAPEVRAITRSDAIVTMQAVVGASAGSDTGTREFEFEIAGRGRVQRAMMRTQPLA
jgi:hypothetical protein